MSKQKDHPFLPPEKISLLSEQKGQSFLEFIFLLAIISSVSFGMVSLANNGIAQRWEFLVNTLIVRDPSQTQTIN